MLVVTRKKRESITLLCGNEKIEIVVTRIDRGAVKIGIIANGNVTAIRSELIQTLKKGAKHGVVEV